MDVQTILEEIGELSTVFAEERRERQLRRSLDPADFDRLRKAGFLLVAVPVDQGGIWESPAHSTRPIAEMLRMLAHADSSLALVASMHPAVLGATGWLRQPGAPEPYTDAWDRQRRWAFQTARDGAWWGTIISEPGSGGDSSKTQAVASPLPEPLAYRLSGDKHFGSGAGITSYMITNALPEGETSVDIFFIDMRELPWDGTAGITLLAAWDGQGMTATQSHAMRFDGVPATRLAWPASSRQSGNARLPVTFTSCAWAGVILGIVETATGLAQQQLSRRSTLRAYEQVEWSRVQMEAWLIEQAYEGMLRAVETDSGAGRSSLFGKITIAELAESALNRLCKVLGGGSYSRSSPFGFWLEDVRALGFLRPPWALAYDALAVTSPPAS
jgi:alkylation response protein AidB-like acyl-CoA dehydrogenase